MFNNDSSFGGGFMQGGGFQGSPASQGDRSGKKKTRADNLVSVSCAQIYQLTQTNDDIMKIGDTPVHMVTIVGLIKSVNPTATCNKYLVDDLSGEPIEVQHWLMGNKGDEMGEVTLMVENTYVRVYGSIRTMQGKVHIQAFNIRPLTSLNELTQHRLEVLYHKLAMEKSGTMNDSMMGNTTAKAGGFQSEMGGHFQSNMGMDSDMQSAETMGFTETQKKIFDVIKSNTELNGASYQWISTTLPRIPLPTIKKEIEWLAMEGHVYTTYDDQHVKATDTM
jgi:replication factor A2